MLFKARAMLLSLVALLLLGSVTAGTACAGAGPFWHHRGVGAKGEGEFVGGEESPQEIQGEGGAQTLMGEVVGTKIEIVVSSAQIKGNLYNNGLQGQAKLELKYHEPKLVKPVLKGCEVVIGTNNTVNVLGHQIWKWNGESKQLEEKPQTKNQRPDWVFLPSEIEEGAKELPKGQITTVALKGIGCSVLLGKFILEGSEIGSITPGNLEEWSTSQTINLSGVKKKQHFWNGEAVVGVETGLTFGGNGGSLEGELKINDPGQELAIFETAVDPPIDEFESPVVGVVGEQEGEHVFKATTTEFKCSTATFTGSVRNRKFIAMTGTMAYMCENGTTVVSDCFYGLGLPSDLAGEPPGLDNKHETKFALAHIPPGCEVTLVNGTCKLKMSETSNTALPMVTFENGLPLKVTFEVTGLSYFGSPACPVGDRELQHNGKYKGKEKIKSANNLEVKIN